MKETIVLGNFITMNDKRPFAKGALVKDGLFAYIGDAAEAKKLAGADAQVLDYGEHFIYPGFLESHCHGYMAGDRAIGQINLAQVLVTDYAKYREIIKSFIADCPLRRQRRDTIHDELYRGGRKDYRRYGSAQCFGAFAIRD